MLNSLKWKTPKLTCEKKKKVQTMYEFTCTLLEGCTQRTSLHVFKDRCNLKVKKLISINKCQVFIFNFVI
jgi:hypothetical protein